MTHEHFVKGTICKLEQPAFEELKQQLLGEYISFTIMEHKDVTIPVLAEKVCDYFSMLEVKTGRSFDKHIESYMNNWDAIVGPHIARTPQAKKGDRTPVEVPRARKYYEKIITLKGVKNLSRTDLFDYSRIMMCLYTAILKSKGNPVENFDFAADCLVPEEIIESMRNEEVSGKFSSSKKKRFNTKELYSSDTCTFILSILILFLIINGKVEGETGHE